VASNAAMSAAENAGLPPAQQDWAPVAAFVHGASRDPNVRRLTVVDADGVVRAASNPALVGQAYRPPAGQLVLRRMGEVTVTDEAGGGFRFVRPIVYAGRPFGQVDVSIDKAELNAAADLSKTLMAGLALVILGVVAAVSYAGARFMAQPMLRLKTALNDAAATGGAVRISHDRRDEFGQVFDSFNRFSAAVQERLEAAEEAAAAPRPTPKPAPPAAFARPSPTAKAGAPDATIIAARVEKAVTKAAKASNDESLGTVIRAPARRRSRAKA